MVTTRGCPFKCNWCAKPIYGNRYNSHSPERIVREIKKLQEKFDFSHIWFADDIFGLKPGWLEKFSKEIKAQNVKIKYKIQSRADLIDDEDTVRHLAVSGCEEVWLGAESGSQKILDAMEKGTTVEQIGNATRLLKKFNVRPCFFLQFGYPGETIEDIHKTLAMVEILKPDDIGISVSYPLPGTKFYEKVRADLSAKQNWKDSDDLQIMFKGPFESEFYRCLQRFVHYKFRTTKEVDAIKKRNLRKKLAYLPYYYYKQLSLKNKMKALKPGVFEDIS
jgi:anaerobic magnesium-protoporphyrin IX monomethyl ester cyclase